MYYYLIFLFEGIVQMHQKHENYLTKKCVSISESSIFLNQIKNT